MRDMIFFGDDPFDAVSFTRRYIVHTVSILGDAASILFIL